MEATNVLFKNTSNLKPPMRLILGERGCYNWEEYELVREDALDSDAEPIVIVRNCEPCVWIEDDVCFILDNMVEGCQDDWPDGLRAWWNEIASNEHEAGEKFTFRSDDDDIVITATFDDTPMTNLRYLEESEI